MLRGFGSRFIFAAALFAGPTTGADRAAAQPAPTKPTPSKPTHAAAPTSGVADIKLPPGTRRDPAGHYVAGRGLRDSTDFVAKELSRRGIAVEQIGPYRIRGVELTRFLSQSSSTTWLAIHVLRVAGKTLIFFVPRAKA